MDIDQVIIKVSGADSGKNGFRALLNMQAEKSPYTVPDLRNKVKCRYKDEFYSVKYLSDYCVFTRFRCIHESRGKVFLGLSLFLPYACTADGAKIYELIDKLFSYFKEQNLRAPGTGTESALSAAAGWGQWNETPETVASEADYEEIPESTPVVGKSYFEDTIKNIDLPVYDCVREMRAGNGATARAVYRSVEGLKSYFSRPLRLRKEYASGYDEIYFIPETGSVNLDGLKTDQIVLPERIETTYRVIFEYLGGDRLLGSDRMDKKWSDSVFVRQDRPGYEPFQVDGPLSACERRPDCTVRKDEPNERITVSCRLRERELPVRFDVVPAAGTEIQDPVISLTPVSGTASPVRLTRETMTHVFRGEAVSAEYRIGFQGGAETWRVEPASFCPDRSGGFVSLSVERPAPVQPPHEPAVSPYAPKTGKPQPASDDSFVKVRFVFTLEDYEEKKDAQKLIGMRINREAVFRAIRQADYCDGIYYNLKSGELRGGYEVRADGYRIKTGEYRFDRNKPVAFEIELEKEKRKFGRWLGILYPLLACLAGILIGGALVYWLFPREKEVVPEPVKKKAVTVRVELKDDRNNSIIEHAFREKGHNTYQVNDNDPDETVYSFSFELPEGYGKIEAVPKPNPRPNPKPDQDKQDIESISSADQKQLGEYIKYLNGLDIKIGEIDRIREWAESHVKGKQAVFPKNTNRIDSYNALIKQCEMLRAFIEDYIEQKGKFVEMKKYIKEMGKLTFVQYNALAFFLNGKLDGKTNLTGDQLKNAYESCNFSRMKTFKDLIDEMKRALE